MPEFNSCRRGFVMLAYCLVVEAAFLAPPVTRLELITQASCCHLGYLMFRYL
jgi:hypothetical protein